MVASCAAFATALCCDGSAAIAQDLPSRGQRQLSCPAGAGCASNLRFSPRFPAPLPGEQLSRSALLPPPFFGAKRFRVLPNEPFIRLPSARHERSNCRCRNSSCSTTSARRCLATYRRRSPVPHDAVLDNAGIPEPASLPAAELEQWPSYWRPPPKEQRRPPTGDHHDKASSQTGPNWTCDPLMNLDAADFAARPGHEASFEARVSADTDSSSTRISSSSAASEGECCLLWISVSQFLCRWPQSYSGNSGRRA